MALCVNSSTHLIPAYYSFYRPRKDERLSWPSWLTCSRWLTHISGHPSAAGRAQDRESSPARDRCSTTIPRHQLSNLVIYSYDNLVNIFYCCENNKKTTVAVCVKLYKKSFFDSVLVCSLTDHDTAKKYSVSNATKPSTHIKVTEKDRNIRHNNIRVVVVATALLTLL